MCRLRIAAPLFGFGLAWLASGYALAAGRMAALAPQVRPAAAPEVRDRFFAAVIRGLKTGTLPVVPAAENQERIHSSDELLQCTGTGACLGHAAAALKADELVASQIEVNGKDYRIKLRLLDPVGRELAKVEEPCDICTVREAEEAIANAAGKLATAASLLPPKSEPEASATPAPTTPPANATPAPTTPPPNTTPPAELASPVEVPPPTLPVPELTSSRPARRTFPWRPVAISSLAAGLVATVIGIPLLAIDGQPTCSLPNPKQSCPEVYNTVGGGAALLAVGVAGITVSGVLFYLDHRARSRRHAAVTLAPLSGGSLVTVGSFGARASLPSVR